MDRVCTTRHRAGDDGRAPRDEPVRDTPGRDARPPADQRQWAATGCGRKMGEHVAQEYTAGPVAALRRIAFLMERGPRGDPAGGGVPQGGRGDPAARPRRRRGPGRGGDPDRPARHRTQHRHRDRRGGARRGARTPGPPGEAVRRPARARRSRGPRRAARRLPLPLRLVRRRLADRGDGDDRHGAGARLPRAHRPLAAAAGGQRAQRGAAGPRSSSVVEAVNAHLGGRVHPAQGDRGRHPRRRRARPDRRDARPPRRARGQRPLQAADGRRRR